METLPSPFRVFMAVFTGMVLCLGTSNLAFWLVAPRAEPYGLAAAASCEAVRSISIVYFAWKLRREDFTYSLAMIFTVVVYSIFEMTLLLASSFGDQPL